MGSAPQVKIYFNSVYMTEDAMSETSQTGYPLSDASACYSAAIGINSGTAGFIDMRNNIFYNTISTPHDNVNKKKSPAIMIYDETVNPFQHSDYNIYKMDRQWHSIWCDYYYYVALIGDPGDGSNVWKHVPLSDAYCDSDFDSDAADDDCKDWQDFTGEDSHSRNHTYTFDCSGGLTPTIQTDSMIFIDIDDLHISEDDIITGEDVGIDEDFDGDPRIGPTIGGDEGCAYGTWKGTDATKPTDWFTASNWGCSHIPTATTNVIIPSGCPAYPGTYSTSDTAKCKTLKIEAGATVTIIDTKVLKCTGQIANYGILGLTSISYIECGGDFTNGGTFTASSTSTVTLNGTTTITTGGTSNYFGNLTIAGAVTLADDININGTFKLQSNSFNTGNNDMFVGGHWLTPNSGGTFTVGTSMVTFDGIATQYVNTTDATGATANENNFTFYNVTISGTDVIIRIDEANQNKVQFNNISIDIDKKLQFKTDQD